MPAAVKIQEPASKMLIYEHIIVADKWLVNSKHSADKQIQKNQPADGFGVLRSCRDGALINYEDDEICSICHKGPTALLTT